MKNQLQKNLWVFSMIMAPLLLAICQFFWKNGILTDTSGWIQVLSFLFWIFAFQGMFDQVKDAFPKYATIGFFIAVFACLGGNNFGVEGIYNEALQISDVEAANTQRSQFGAGGIIGFFLPGGLFPLSLLVIGIQLWRAKKIEGWLSVLVILAAVGFPLSRITRIEWIAHVDNFIMLGVMILVASRISKNLKTLD